MDKEEIQKQIEAIPVLKAFHDSGDNDRVSRRISMAYLLNSIANTYAEEANEILEKYDLVHKKIKTRATNLTTAFDLYDKEVFTLLKGNGEAQRQFCNGYEIFKAECDRFMLSDDAAKVYVNLRTGRVVKPEHPEATMCLICKKRDDKGAAEGDKGVTE